MFTREHTYDLTRHFKIWFSKNPDVPLGGENELRLIRWRKKNPDLTLSLMTSSACLTTEAYEKLKTFCKQHRLNLVDFDTEVLPTLTHPSDIAIFQLAQQELEHVRTHSGGNLAAASDLARMILPVLQTHGIYSDHDADITINEAAQPPFKAKTPVILLDSRAIRGLNNIYRGTELNNAVVMIPEPHPKADKFFRDVQAFLIGQYQLSGDNALESRRYHFIEQLMTMTDNETSFKTLFECRRVLEHFMQHPDKLLEAEDGAMTDAKKSDILSVLDKIYMETVTEVSGPAMWRAYIHDSYVKEMRTHGQNPESPLLQDALLQAEAGMVAAMHPCLIDRRVSLKTAKHKYETYQQSGDLSWMLFGESSKQARDAKLTATAIILQRAWRKKHP